MKKLFKKSLAVILVVVLTLTAAPLSSFVGLDLSSLFDFKAEAKTSNSTCGDSVYWSLTDGVLQISGTGPMFDYTNGTPWRWDEYYIKSVYITDGVTHIGDSAFKYCHNLTTAIIGNSVTTIGSWAFSGTRLTNISIPDSVTTIGSWAFSGTPLTNISIPDSVTSIGEGAFADTSLTDISIPDSVTSIGDDAFANCDFTTISIPENVLTIGDGAFIWCSNLTSVSIPSSVISIGYDAFCGCSALTNITFANDSQLTTIGDYAFNGCENLTSFSVPDSVTTIGDNAFHQCTNLEYVHIPASVTSIGYGILSDENLSVRIVYICSTTRDCYAREYALKNWIKFKVCDGHETDKPTDDNEDKPYKVHGRDFKHNLDYFAKNGDSSKYDPELANMLAALSDAVYNENDIRDAYVALGFENVVLYDYYGNFNLDSAGYALAFKQTESGETICLVTVRGSSNVSDWIGNIETRYNNTGDVNHLGFSKPADRIYKTIETYLGGDVSNSNVKFYVTGHSRGAAVANLLSVKLMENDVPSSDVYNYNYACPDVTARVSFPEYNNIYNISNRTDVVPKLPGIAEDVITPDMPGVSWGKYGQTHSFTKFASGLNSINPIANHNMKLYLEHMDSQTHYKDWDKNVFDNINDGISGATYWVGKVLCPVDVIVTDKTGKNIASVINGEINYYDSAFGDVIILTDGDKKVIYINGDKDFNVNLVGTDNGEMTYSVEKYNIFTEETLESKTFENVKLEKGKEMQSPVYGDKTVDDVSLYVYENNNGEKTVKYAVNTDGSEIEIGEAFKDFAIKQPSVTTIKYGDTLVLNADIGGYTLPAGYTVKWFVEGAGVSTSVSEDGLECRVTSVASGNATIYAKLVDADENVVTNVEGEEILDEITITSKAGFWQKFISFFKNLFRINRIIY